MGRISLVAFRYRPSNYSRSFWLRAEILAAAIAVRMRWEGEVEGWVCDSEVTVLMGWFLLKGIQIPDSSIFSTSSIPWRSSLRSPYVERGRLEADGLALIIVARQFVVLGPIRTRERR